MECASIGIKSGQLFAKDEQQIDFYMMNEKYLILESVLISA